MSRNWPAGLTPSENTLFRELTGKDLGHVFTFFFKKADLQASKLEIALQVFESYEATRTRPRVQMV